MKSDKATRGMFNRDAEIALLYRGGVQRRELAARFRLSTAGIHQAIRSPNTRNPADLGAVGLYGGSHRFFMPHVFDQTRDRESHRPAMSIDAASPPRQENLHPVRTKPVRDGNLGHCALYTGKNAGTFLMEAAGSHVSSPRHPLFCSLPARPPRTFASLSHRRGAVIYRLQKIVDADGGRLSAPSSRASPISASRACRISPGR